MKLYEIDQEIREIQAHMEDWAAENDGDVTGFGLSEYLQELEGEKKGKLLWLAVLYKEYSAEADVLKNEAKLLAARAKTAENKAEKIKSFISSNLTAGEKMKDSHAEIGWRKSVGLMLSIEPEMLPSEFQKVKVEADKSGIAEAIKDGKKVEGAWLEQRNNIQIK